MTRPTRFPRPAWAGLGRRPRLRQRLLLRPGRRSRGRRQDGLAAIELSLGICLFLLPVAMIVFTLPTWPERQNLARAAAEEAALLAVSATNPTDGYLAGEIAVERTAINHGLDPTDLTITWDGQWCRGCEITAHVQVRIPAITIPMITTIAETSWTASHTERLDDYRSLP